MNRKTVILICLICGYLFCLYVGVSGQFPFLNQYSKGDYRGKGSGYLWETLGTFFCLGMLPCIPDRYYVKYKNSKVFAFLLIVPFLILCLVALWKMYLR